MRTIGAQTLERPSSCLGNIHVTAPKVSDADVSNSQPVAIAHIGNDTVLHNGVPANACAPVVEYPDEAPFESCVCPVVGVTVFDDHTLQLCLITLLLVQMNCVVCWVHLL